MLCLGNPVNHFTPAPLNRIEESNQGDRACRGTGKYFYSGEP
jgi:hypothetical protein